MVTVSKKRPRILTVSELREHEKDQREVDKRLVSVALRALAYMEARSTVDAALVEETYVALAAAAQRYNELDHVHREKWSPIFAECAGTENPADFCRGCGLFLISRELGPYCHRCSPDEKERARTISETLRSAAARARGEEPSGDAGAP